MDGEIGKLYQGIKVINPTKEKVFFPGYRFSKIVSLAEIQTLDYPAPVKKMGFCMTWRQAASSISRPGFLVTNWYFLSRSSRTIPSKI
jgi:hypothetical protein